MGLKSAIALLYAKKVSSKIKKESKNAIRSQRNCFLELISTAAQTKFGQDHKFSEIRTYKDFVERVPVRDYEELSSYIELLKQGKPNILWPGKPAYLSKTSGTTSGVKYIPITKDSIPNHINTARNALMCYVAAKNSAAIVDGKMIFLSGSPELTQINGIPLGRLSGIVNHHVPGYLKGNQLPSFETNCIEDWEAKLDAIVEETMNRDMTVISGIPPWVQMYFDKLTKNSGKRIKELFPNFSLFVYGGVNYDPYRSKLENSIGAQVDSVELYPASEGFIAYQDSLDNSNGMLLNTNSGIFYEFVKADDFFNEDRQRISLEDVVVGENYAIILSTNAGLWAYNIGDTVKFISVDPYRLVVSGRIKHFISAFGEHVIAQEVDKAISEACAACNVAVTEFTVAPEVTPNTGLPYHEWFVEFETEVEDLQNFEKVLNDSMIKQNIYYKDLITGNVLKDLVVNRIKKNGFIDYMKSKGKLGGQNKLPRLSNDRKIADELSTFTIKKN
ncbi:MAG: hypothetical protein HKN22_08845 [Bacteroidia bacterium]|nr:hypothetical protein [Bacteroidia bacterium]